MTPNTNFSETALKEWAFPLSTADCPRATFSVIKSRIFTLNYQKDIGWDSGICFAPLADKQFGELEEKENTAKTKPTTINPNPEQPQASNKKGTT